ncbi:MAG TPA: HAD family hydrolase [Allosphingosinicella sp.]|nr:HAD family hydrolase [Allosphingosinicella sp.]
MPRITALLFDIDGTLVDSNDFHVTAWQEVFSEAGHEFPRELIHGQVGKGGDNLLPGLLPDLSEEEQEAIAQKHGPRYQERYIGRVRPFPGARDLLARAKQDGLKVALATSANPEELDHYVELLDAADLIDVTTSKGDVEATKPAPDIFAAAVKKAGVAPEQALVIGDTPYDVLAARRAGVGALGLLSGGFPEEDLRAAGAVAVYRDAADLLAQWDSSPIKTV